MDKNHKNRGEFYIPEGVQSYDPPAVDLRRLELHTIGGVPQLVRVGREEHMHLAELRRKTLGLMDGLMDPQGDNFTEGPEQTEQEAQRVEADSHIHF